MKVESIKTLSKFLSTFPLSLIAEDATNKLNKNGTAKILSAKLLETPLGELIAISDDSNLLLLQFMERSSISLKLRRLIQRLSDGSPEITGTICIKVSDSKPITQIEQELKLYFMGKLQQFHTPLFHVGSEFQVHVWEELKTIPYGAKYSYAQLAKNIGRAKAYRSVAQANAANPLVIIVPCHRVINSNGNMGGYNGGLDRKESLIALERTSKKKLQI